jgi:hypothetical protein
VSEKDHNKKLHSRANKRQSQRKFKPEEYADDKTSFYEIDLYTNYVAKNNINISEALFLAASNINELKNNPVFQREMESWHREISNISKQHIDWFKKRPLNISNGDVLVYFINRFLRKDKKQLRGLTTRRRQLFGILSKNMQQHKVKFLILHVEPVNFYWKRRMLSRNRICCTELI